MRFPTLPTLIRTFTLTNITTATFGNPTALHRLPRVPLAFTNRNTTLLRSMPSIPFLGSLFSSFSGQQSKDMTDYPIKKSEDEWQAVLSPEQFRVIREKGTEAPYTGEYDKHMPSEGTYVSRSYPSTLPSYTASIHQEKKGRKLSVINLLTLVAGMRRLPHAPLPRDAQVQIRLRLARLLRLHPRRRDPTHGFHVRYVEDGDHVQ